MTEIVLLGLLGYVLTWGVLTWIALQVNYAFSRDYTLLHWGGFVVKSLPWSDWYKSCRSHYRDQRPKRTWEII